MKVGVGCNRYRYNGKEWIDEIGLSDYGARWYDPAIARWTAIDPLAPNYAGYSPYNYVLNNPIIAIDPDGRYVKITNEDDQKYFLEQLTAVLGNEAGGAFSFSKSGFLKVNKKALKGLEEGNTKDIVSDFRDLANDKNFGIEFTTQVSNDGKYVWNPDVTVTTTEQDEDGNNVKTSTTIKAFTGSGANYDLNDKTEGIFTSLKNAPDPRISDNRALIILSRKTANTGTFSAQGGGTTDPCAGCVIIHEFLDHGKPWMSGQKDNNVVTAHNKALKIKGSKQRDGKDHD